MKNNLYLLVIAAIITLIAQTAFADVKIKAQQTISGQKYDNTTFIKGKRQRTESMGGAMISITQCDLARAIQINPQSRTYMVNPFATTTSSTSKPAVSQGRTGGVVQTGGKVTTTITTKDTGERKQMFGFTARHLIITMETVSSADACNKSNSKIQTDGWYIDAEFALDCDQTYSANAYNAAGKNGGCQDRYEMKQIGTAKRGYPVYEKMTMFDAFGKETMSMVSEVVELSKAVLDAGLFDVPQDYREVSDASQMYASGYGNGQAGTNNAGSPINSALAKNVQDLSRSGPSASTVAPKKPGTIRIGLVGVEATSVGEGITGSDLAAAVQNALIQKLKTSAVDVVTLSKDGANDAKQKECDFIMYATVGHKKGGGGFGSMFGSALGSTIGQVGIGHTGSVVGNVVGQVATQAIITAVAVSANVKSKDEITLGVKVQPTSGAAVLDKQFKAKARSNGEDIITQVIEQASLAVAGVIQRV